MTGNLTGDSKDPDTKGHGIWTMSSPAMMELDRHDSYHSYSYGAMCTREQWESQL
jgi:hypothetical protein